MNNMPQCIWWCEAISDALHRISLYISCSIFSSGVSFFINRMQNHLFGCTSSITMRKSKSQDLIRLLAGTKSKKGYHDPYRQGFWIGVQERMKNCLWLQDVGWDFCQWVMSHEKSEKGLGFQVLHITTLVLSKQRKKNMFTWCCAPMDEMTVRWKKV